MDKPKLTPRERAAMPHVVQIVSRSRVYMPIPTADVVKELKKRNHFISDRSVRAICEYCCLSNPPVPLLYKSGHPGGLYRPRNLEEAKPFIDDSGSRAFSSLKRRQNIINYLRISDARKRLGVEQKELNL